MSGSSESETAKSSGNESGGDEAGKDDGVEDGAEEGLSTGAEVVASLAAMVVDEEPRLAMPIQTINIVSPARRRISEEDAIPSASNHYTGLPAQSPVSASDFYLLCLTSFRIIGCCY